MIVLQTAFAEMHGRIDPPSSLSNMTMDDLAATARLHEIWVIGRPAVATVTLTLRPGCLYLGKLAVLPAQRGQGLARQLVTLAERRARALACPEVMLETRIELVENHALFRYLGFRETARRAHAGYDRPTTIEFRKTVSADLGPQV